MKPKYDKPQFYTYVFSEMRRIAEVHGYNLLIHGSMNRDLDLVLIPWEKQISPIDTVMSDFCNYVGGKMMYQTPEQRNVFPHGRLSYVIELNRGGYALNPDGSWDETKFIPDPEYYIDISVIPIK